MAWNYFNPTNGPSYSSKAGLLGSGNPLSGGNDSSAQNIMNGGSGWQDWLQSAMMSGGDPLMTMLMHGMGIGSGGIMGMLDPLGIFGSGPNPADAAMPYLNKGQGIVDKYMDPYISAGQKALPTLQDQYGQLINNPGGVMNKIGAGFQQSPGYQWQVNQSLDAANKAAAASGMAGSPAEQQQIATTANQLANQDYNNYMNRGVGMYNTGLGGMSHIFDTGAQASTSAMQQLMDLINTQAQLAYAGQANQNQSKGGMLGSLMSLAPLAMAFL